MPSPRLVSATTVNDLQSIREMFQEYERGINVDLCFQGFAHELATLPGSYVAPRGKLLLALQDGVPVGCAGLRPLEDAIAELKRLYVRPAARGMGLGRKLATAIVDAARDSGYDVLRLDTLASMSEAIGLYRSLGFRRIAPYMHSPLSDPLYFELVL
jgi:putative acetyltransferase